ncbi:YlbF family regulator [Peribacillus kribbensis]|uniref:YlbF family regulator n=1 Tax=Peribacillus kribbensis TaxID=356658 RepID=UPI0003FAB2F5|nr:YlbF family regulator [Peribacillus kribbensis]
MLATIESMEILDYAEHIARAVIESDIGEQYFLSLYKVQADKLAQEKIRKFTAIKELYEEVQRFGKYHPDYSEISLKARQLKREMDVHPTIAEYKFAETELQNLLDEVSMRVGSAVSKHIKVPTGNPFFDSGSSCSGGCGSGGSCGCS